MPNEYGSCRRLTIIHTGLNLCLSFESSSAFISCWFSEQRNPHIVSFSYKVVLCRSIYAMSLQRQKI